MNSAKAHKLLDQFESEIKDNLSRLEMPESESGDEIDAANNLRDQEFIVIQRNRYKNQLNQIHEARQRVEDGTFGVCDDCGEDIPVARIKAMPKAKYCVECQDRNEKFNKAKKHPSDSYSAGVFVSNSEEE